MIQAIIPFYATPEPQKRFSTAEEEVHQKRLVLEEVHPAGADTLEVGLPGSQGPSPAAAEPNPGGNRSPDATGADTPGRVGRRPKAAAGVQPLADTGQGMAQQRRRRRREEAAQTDLQPRCTAEASAGLRRQHRGVHREAESRS